MANKNEQLFSFIQLLRYAAAVMIILFHLGIDPSGYKGVDLFFIISGFVLYYRYQIMIALSDMRLYCIKRVTKIYLLYWTCLLLYYFYQPYPINSSLLKSVFLIPGHYAIIPVSWSLSYELFFYFMFGCWILIPADRMRRITFGIFLGITSLVVILNTTAFSLKGTVFNFFLGQNIWEFALGVFIGYLYREENLLKGYKILRFIIWAAVFCFISMPFGNSKSSIIYGICGCLLVYSASGLNNPAKKAGSVFNALGQASYTLYLISPIALGIFWPESSFEVCMLILTVSIASIFINRLYEEPLLKKTRAFLIASYYNRKK